MPVPGREWIKQNGITFLNHQAASCVCSPARSTIYTGEHIQHTGVFDNAGSLWQADMSTEVKTIGHRLAELGYHAAYQGKWHLSNNLDQVKEAIDAPLRTIAKSSNPMASTISSASATSTTPRSAAITTTTPPRPSSPAGCAPRARSCGRPESPGISPSISSIRMTSCMSIPTCRARQFRARHRRCRSPATGRRDLPGDMGRVPLPSTRGQSFDAPGRPRGQKNLSGGAGRSRRRVAGRGSPLAAVAQLLLQLHPRLRPAGRRVLEALKANGMDKNTIIVFTADHGELGGNHQMRGKGNCAYRQQNHLPLMIVHPAYPGGKTCQAVTSQIDLAPTLLALTGAEPASLQKAGAGLKGRSFSALMARAGHGEVRTRCGRHRCSTTTCCPSRTPNGRGKWTNICGTRRCRSPRRSRS